MSDEILKNLIVPLIGSRYASDVIPLIDKAKESICVLMFDWRWVHNGLGSNVQLFNQAMVRAVRRGVKILAVVNSDEIVGTLKSVGIEAKKARTNQLLHSKLLLIDRDIVILGSHNISNNAFDHNFETSIKISDEATCSTYRTYFNTIWAL